MPDARQDEAWQDDAWVGRVADAAVGADLGVAGLTGTVVVAVPPTAAARRGGRAPTARSSPSSAPEVRVRLEVADGVVTGWERRGGGDALVTFTLPAPDAAPVVGGLPPSVAFMRGRLKVDGDPGAALAVLAATSRPGWAAALEAAVAGG